MVQLVHADCIKIWENIMSNTNIVSRSTHFNEIVTVIRTHCVGCRASGFVDVDVGTGGAAWSLA